MKKYKQLTSEQRYAIFLEMKNSASQREIAKKIGVSPSTVSRKVRRNKNKHTGYLWCLAQEMANEHKEHFPGNRTTSEWIKQKVFRQVRQDWSPNKSVDFSKDMSQ